MKESCPNTFPEDWVDPRIIRSEHYDVTEYEDGVRVIIEEPYYIYGYAVEPPSIETRYPNRALHYEHGVDEDGNLTGHSTYIPDGIPKDAEI